jgi:type II secretory pathway predicted ATPase ExeA
LKLAVLAALDQRISTRYTITGMNLTDTGESLRHHLSLAGRADTLFSGDTVTAIHQASRGYPRAVDNLAVSSLIVTYAADETTLGVSAVKSAITDNSK